MSRIWLESDVNEVLDVSKSSKCLNGSVLLIEGQAVSVRSELLEIDQLMMLMWLLRKMEGIFEEVAIVEIVDMVEIVEDNDGLLLVGWNLLEFF